MAVRRRAGVQAQPELAADDGPNHGPNHGADDRAGSDTGGGTGRPTVVATNVPVEPATTRPTTGPVVASGGPATPAVGLHAEDAADAPMATLGSTAEANPTYSLALSINPRGAGIDAVTLNQFHKTANDKNPYTFQVPATEAVDGTRSLATGSVTVDKTDVDLTLAHWRQTAATADAATYAVRILDGTQAGAGADQDLRGPEAGRGRRQQGVTTSSSASRSAT